MSRISAAIQNISTPDSEVVITTAGLDVSVECTAEIIDANQDPVPISLFPPLSYYWIGIDSSDLGLSRNLTFSPVWTSNAGRYNCIPVLSIPQLGIAFTDSTPNDIDAILVLQSRYTIEIFRAVCF